MSERWIPVLTAFVGLLAGMGGALVGGQVANEGQETQFFLEQQARAHDLRRSAFAKFLQEAADVEFSLEGTDENAVNKLRGAEAAVGLFAKSEVRNAASTLVSVAADEPPYPEELGNCPDEVACYLEAQGQFV